MTDSKPTGERGEEEPQARDAAPKEEAGLSDPKPNAEDSKPQNEKWYERTRYQILLFAGGIALFVLVGGWILDWYIEPRTSGQKKDPFRR